MTIPFYDRILDSIEAYFALSPTMLALSVKSPGPATGAPPTRISLKVAREIIRSQTVAAEERDAIWSQLVRLAQMENEPWDLAAVWLMTPGLNKMCSRCRRYSSGIDLAELQAEAVAGFLEEVKTADADRQELESWLWWTTYRRLRRACSRQRREMLTAQVAVIADRRAWRLSQETAVLQGQRPPRSRHSGLSKTNPITATLVESERLGSLAHRMGLTNVLPRTTALDSTERAA